MPDVFMSYNRQDKETAQLVARCLSAEGFDVWWDADLRAGEAYDEVTERNLRAAAAVVVLWSKQSVNSKWVRAEATVGERSSILVPALIEDCDRPVRFELVQTADLTRWRGDREAPAWRMFVMDVRRAVDARRASSAATPAPPPRAAAEGVPKPQPAPDGGVTIETTFWTSIKDSADASDFDAYLVRYPHGHFADLAKNRLANLARAKRVDPAPARHVEARQADVRSSQEAHPAPSPRSEPARAPATATKAAAPPQRASGPSPLLLAGAALVVLALLGGAFLVLSGGGEKPTVVADAAPPATSAPAPEAQPAPMAPPPPPAATAPPAASPAPSEPPALSEAVVAAPPSDGKTFKDCEFCPEMKRLSGGTFKMGSPDDERGRNPWEGPQKPVTVPPFAVALYETTEAEWRACVEDKACPQKRSRGADRLPVLGVTWNEAQGYAQWLSRKTGKTYRLPSEAEWEFAARGGSQSAYAWGEAFDASKVATREPKPVGSFAANAFGVFDMTGNAREWTEDCYVNNYTETPTDGSPNRQGDCSMRAIRGGSWSSSPTDLRIANRSRILASATAQYMGVRVVVSPP